MILRAAYFEICPHGCQRHGHIVYSDKTKSDEVGFGAAMQAVIQQARKEGKLTDIEADVLERQNNTLGLARVVAEILEAIVGTLSDATEAKPASGQRTQQMYTVHPN